MKIKPEVTIIRIVSFLAFIIVRTEAEFDYGRCPKNIDSVPISAQDVNGRWYEIKKSKKSFGGGKKETCNYFDFNLSSDYFGVTLNINSTSFNDKGSLTSHLIEGTYNDLPPNLQSTDYIYGDFKIDFKNFKSQNPLKPNLHFVHIDANFALVYFCESSGPFKLSLGWILSRDLHPDFALLKNIEAKLKDLNLVDIRTLETVDQSHCSTNGNSRFLANGIRMLPVKDDGSTNEDLMFVRCMMMSSDTFFHDLLYCKERSRENSRRNSLENSPVKSNPKTSG